MRQLFISDLHLEEQRPDILRAFFQFLHQQAPGCEALYILGDFFEVWVGDDDDRPLVAEVAAALKGVAASGVQIYLMRGNRDFLLGEDFCQRAGAQLLPDPSVIRLAGENCLLMHGDSLCTADEKYMAFRREARSPQWQAGVLAKPLEERRALAQQLRMASHEANSSKAEDIMDVTPAEVMRVMAEHNCRRLIHGHTHRPARHAIAEEALDGERIVLGDWGNTAWYLEADGDQLNLKDALAALRR